MFIYFKNFDIWAVFLEKSQKNFNTLLYFSTLEFFVYISIFIYWNKYILNYVIYFILFLSTVFLNFYLYVFHFIIFYLIISLIFWHIWNICPNFLFDCLDHFFCIENFVYRLIFMWLSKLLWVIQLPSFYNCTKVQSVFKSTDSQPLIPNAVNQKVNPWMYSYLLLFESFLYFYKRPTLISMLN